MTSSSGSDLEVEVRSGPASLISSGHEARAEPVSEPVGSVVKEFVDLQGREIKIPERVLKVLRESKNFQEFKENRKFKYLHLFSGHPDVLSEAIIEEGRKNRIWIECRGLDRKADSEIDLHETDTIMRWKKEIEEDLWDGLHSGWPCGSFSMARWKPGGPPPVRSRDEIYGMATNNVKQQQEADRGTLAATRSVALMKLQCARADARGIPRVATGENPPGTDGIEGSAWLLPEIVQDLREMEAEEAVFNTCAFQDGKVRWYKPGKWAGKLGDETMADMRKICKCPNWVRHQPLLGKELTEPAGQYPKRLVESGGDKDCPGLQEDSQLGVVEVSDGHQEGRRYGATEKLAEERRQEEEARGDVPNADRKGRRRRRHPEVFGQGVEERNQRGPRQLPHRRHEEPVKGGGKDASSWQSGDGPTKRMGEVLEEQWGRGHQVSGGLRHERGKVRRENAEEVERQAP